MNKYTIYGLNRVTAQKEFLNVEAASQEKAVQMAKTLFVSKVVDRGPVMKQSVTKAPTNNRENLSEWSDFLVRSAGVIHWIGAISILLSNLVFLAAALGSTVGEESSEYAIPLFFMFFMSLVWWPLHIASIAFLNIAAYAGLVYAEGN